MCKNDFYNPCTAYCALSASDNSRVGVATLLHVTNRFCITNQYNHYKKADEQLCAIGNRLYRREKPNAEGYRILQRSSDFVMFVVQGNTPMTYGRTYTLINKTGREVVMKEQNEVI